MVGVVELASVSKFDVSEVAIVGILHIPQRVNRAASHAIVASVLKGNIATTAVERDTFQAQGSPASRCDGELFGLDVEFDSA